MFTSSPRTMSPFLHERIVPRPRNTLRPIVIPVFEVPLASSTTRSSTTTPAQAVLCVRSTTPWQRWGRRSREEGIEGLAQDESESPRHPRRGQHDRLVQKQTAQAPAPDHDVLVAVQRRLATPGDGILDSEGQRP
jgi:hypothetical protein